MSILSIYLKYNIVPYTNSTGANVHIINLSKAIIVPCTNSTGANVHIINLSEVQ